MNNFAKFILIVSICLTLVACNIANIKKATISSSEPTETVKSTLQTCQPTPTTPETSTWQTKEFQEDTLQKLFLDCSELHTGTAGSSMQIAAVAATWLNTFCCQEHDFPAIASKLATFIQSLPAAKQANFSSAWQLLSSCATEMLNNKQITVALARDAGVNLNSKDIKAEYWQALEKAITDALQQRQI